MSNNLEKYFEAARNEPPVIEVSEVSAMLSSAKPGKPSGNARQWLIRAGIIVTGAGLICLFLLRPAGPDDVKTTHGRSPEPLPTPAIAQTAEAEPATPAKATIYLKAGSPAIELSRHPESSESLPPEPEAIQAATQTERLHSRDEYLHLSYEDLARLGIRSNGNTLVYANLLDTLFPAPADSEPGKTYRAFFSLDVEEHGSASVSQYWKNSDQHPESTPFWPAFVQVIQVDNHDTILNSTGITIHRGDKQALFLQAKDLLIPVEISLQPVEGRYSHPRDVIFWFPPHPLFMASLPETLRNRIQSMYTECDLLKYEELRRKHDEWRKPAAPVFSKEQVERLQARFVHPDRKQLKKLGITLRRDEYVMKGHFYVEGHPASVKMTQRQGNGYINIIADSKIRPGKDLQPVCISDSLLTNMSYLYVLPDSLTWGGQNSHFVSEKLFREEINHLVPVCFNLPNKRKTVIWFKKTDQLKRVLGLPVRRPHSVNMTGIPVISVDSIALEKLKITVTYDGIKTLVNGTSAPFFITYSKDGSKLTIETSDTSLLSGKQAQDSIKGATLILNDGHATRISIPGNNLAKVRYPEPVLISNRGGNEWRTYRLEQDMPDSFYNYMQTHHLLFEDYPPYMQLMLEAEESLTLRINTLVPVWVKAKEPLAPAERAQQSDEDLLFWYEPDSLFLSILPSQTAMEMSSEIRAIKKGQASASCKYFNACNQMKGALTELRIFPNPVTENFRLQVSASEDRVLHARITDISGRTVKTLLEEEYCSQGSHEFNFRTDGLAEGMYILIAETDRKEYITQRLIKK